RDGAPGREDRGTPPQPVPDGARIGLGDGARILAPVRSRLRVPILRPLRLRRAAGGGPAVRRAAGLHGARLHGGHGGAAATAGDAGVPPGGYRAVGAAARLAVTRVSGPTLSARPSPLD